MGDETSQAAADASAAVAEGAAAAKEGAAAAAEAATPAAKAAAEAAKTAAAAAAEAAKKAGKAGIDRAKSLKSTMELPQVNLNLSICDGLTEKFKIFAAFCQVNNLFYETLKIPWPSAIQELYAAMGLINFDLFTIFSVGCVTGASFLFSLALCLSRST